MTTLLTASEAAERLRICVRSLKNYIRANKIRHVRLPGGQIRIEEGELERFIQQRTFGPRLIDHQSQHSGRMA